MTRVIFERVLASTACPAFVTDGKGLVLGLNGPAERLLGCDSPSVQGRRCREVFAGRDRFNNRFCLERCAVREMVAHDEAVNPFDLCLQTVSGATIDVSMSVVAVRDRGRKRPAILHLLRPVEQAADAKRWSKVGQPIAREHKDPADSPPCLNGNGFKGLTSREHELLVLLAAGKSCHEMALALGIGLVTVRNHLKRIFPKLQVHSQAEAVSFAFRNGLI